MPVDPVTQEAKPGELLVFMSSRLPYTIQKKTCKKKKNSLNAERLGIYWSKAT